MNPSSEIRTFTYATIQNALIMKRSFALAFFFLTVWFITGCDTSSCGCATYDLNIEVVIEDAAGNNLLDPSTANHFTEQDIDMFYEVKGKLRTYASMGSGQVDNPKGFDIGLDQAQTQYLLYLSSNPTAGKKVVTILRIKDKPDIRLVTRVNGGDGARIEKVWYQDQLVWPVPGNEYSRRITVTID